MAKLKNNTIVFGVNTLNYFKRLLMLGIAFTFINARGQTMQNETITTSKGKTLKLVWHDEFDGSELDESKWGYDTGYIRNHEHQYYTKNRKKNLRIEDSKLIIEAHREDYDYGKGIAKCTSAEITTFGKAAWKYGRFEIKAKVPMGKGTWPAIWMMGTDIHKVGWPRCGEIDIMEYVGYQPGVFHFTLHGTKNGKYTRTGGKNFSTTIPEERLAVFAIEWDEAGIRYFIDNTLVADFVRGKEIDMEPYPFDKEMYLLLNLAIGGDWGGQQGIDEGIFPARYEIDYVRVYQ